MGVVGVAFIFPGGPFAFPFENYRWRILRHQACFNDRLKGLAVCWVASVFPFWREMKGTPFQSEKGSGRPLQPYLCLKGLKKIAGTRASKPLKKRKGKTPTGKAEKLQGGKGAGPAASNATFENHLAEPGAQAPATSIYLLFGFGMNEPLPVERVGVSCGASPAACRGYN